MGKFEKGKRPVSAYNPQMPAAQRNNLYGQNGAQKSSPKQNAAAPKVKKNRLPRSLPITISGSVWRSHPLLFDTFRDTLSSAGMDGHLHIPAFEPIVGAVIGHAYARGIRFTEEERRAFAESYAKHAFEVASDLRHRPNPQKIVPTVAADAPIDAHRRGTVIDF